MTENDKVLFKTDRLIVRKWHHYDLDQIQSLYSDLSVVKWVDDGTPISLEETKKWLEVTSNNYKHYGYGMYSLILKDTNTFVGCGGIVHPNKQKSPEVKYAFKKSYWSKGLATEFVKDLIFYFDNSYNKDSLYKLTASVHPNNKKSINVLKKCNFKQFKILKNEDQSTTLYFILSKIIK